MAACDINKIDSNITGLSFAEEECLRQLPATPVWFGLEPNSYSDFGGEISTVARAPIDPSRQNKKGTVTDLNASGGFNIDVTKSNLTRLLQGFFFANARELASSEPLNAAKIAITAVTGTAFQGASLNTRFSANALVLAENFGTASNNGVKLVTAVSAGNVTANGLTAEASPPADAKITQVGYQFASAQLSIAIVGGRTRLVAASGDLTALGLFTAGNWIFIGGDTTHFDNNIGYARISTVAAGYLEFDQVTWTPVAEAGTGKVISVYLATIIKNESSPNLIVRRSYNIERTLGQGPTSVQAEYLEGAVANEFTLNIPQADKINADLTFVACDNVHRTGEAGDEIKSGTRVAAKGEDAFNTSSQIHTILLSVQDNTTSKPSALFGFLTEATLSISNDVTPNKALGTIGAIDTSAGNFTVGGSLTAYFSTVEAVKAVRNNADVGLHVIIAAENSGFLYDIPLLGLGGGRVNVEKDQPITVPLEPMGAQSNYGHTMLYQTFPYLPDVAMPD